MSNFPKDYVPESATYLEILGWVNLLLSFLGILFIFAKLNHSLDKDIDTILSIGLLLEGVVTCVLFHVIARIYITLIKIQNNTHQEVIKEL